MSPLHPDPAVQAGEISFAMASVCFALLVLAAQNEIVRTRTLRLFFVSSYYLMYVITAALVAITHIYYRHIIPLQYLSESISHEHAAFSWIDFGMNCWMMIGITISFVTVKLKDEH